MGGAFDEHRSTCTRCAVSPGWSPPGGKRAQRLQLGGQGDVARGSGLPQLRPAQQQLHARHCRPEGAVCRQACAIAASARQLCAAGAQPLTLQRCPAPLEGRRQALAAAREPSAHSTPRLSAHSQPWMRPASCCSCPSSGLSGNSSSRWATRTRSPASGAATSSTSCTAAPGVATSTSVEAAHASGRSARPRACQVRCLAAGTGCSAHVSGWPVDGCAASCCSSPGPDVHGACSRPGAAAQPPSRGARTHLHHLGCGCGVGSSGMPPGGSPWPCPPGGPARACLQPATPPAGVLPASRGPSSLPGDRHPAHAAASETSTGAADWPRRCRQTCAQLACMELRGCAAAGQHPVQRMCAERRRKSRPVTLCVCGRPQAQPSGCIPVTCGCRHHAGGPAAAPAWPASLTGA